MQFLPSPRIASLPFIFSLLVAAPATAEDCSYTDLHGELTVFADCAGLQDFSGIAQHHKRLWLSGPWGQLQVMEVPSPYQGAKLDVIIETLSRTWSRNRVWSSEGVTNTTVAGADARVILKRRLRTTSRTWVFNFGGRNLTARAVAYGQRKAREANLDSITAAFERSFKAKSE